MDIVYEVAERFNGIVTTQSVAIGELFGMKDEYIIYIMEKNCIITFDNPRSCLGAIEFLQTTYKILVETPK